MCHAWPSQSPQLVQPLTTIRISWNIHWLLSRLIELPPPGLCFQTARTYKSAGFLEWSILTLVGCHGASTEPIAKAFTSRPSRILYLDWLVRRALPWRSEGRGKVIVPVPQAPPRRAQGSGFVRIAKVSALPRSDAQVRAHVFSSPCKANPKNISARPIWMPGWIKMWIPQDVGDQGANARGCCDSDFEKDW